MNKVFLKRLFVLLLMTCAVFSAAIILSCSNLLGSKTSGSLSFNITVPRSDPSEYEWLFKEGFSLDITISGDYSASKTVVLEEKQNITFDSIPVGSVIVVSAEIYIPFDEEWEEGGETGGREVFYKGTSEEITIKPGKNDANIVMKAVDPDEPDPGEIIIPIEIHVSANGDDATGDGTEGSPFASIDAAVEKINELNDVSSAYIIYISGELTGYFGLGVKWDDNIESDTYRGWIPNELVAKSITLEGKTGSDTDILKYPEENLGSDVLEIQTSVPVTITKLKITGGQTGIGVNSPNAEVTLGEGCLVTDNSSGVSVSGGTVTLAGGIITDNSNDQGGGVYLSGGEFILESGYIKANGAAYYGGGVYVCGGTFTMNGGEISGNVNAGGSLSGAGVYVGFDGDTIGEFIMNGGEITNNVAYDKGGAVYVDGGATFIMNGGTISGNEATGAGGGVYIDGTNEDYQTVFTMNDGTISGNTQTSSYDEGPRGGGGVSLYGENAKFNMMDGTICKNEAACYGGAVSVINNAVFDMEGGTIGGESENEGNKVIETGASTYGGGVYVSDSASFNMNGGTISYNSTLGTDWKCGGGAVCAYSGTFTMNEGFLSANNSSGSGGAVYIGSGGTFEMKGGTISDNTCNSECYGKAVYVRNYNGTCGTFIASGSSMLIEDDNDVYLPTGAVIMIADELSGGNVATITPSSYEIGTAVLASEDEGLLERNYNVFALTPSAYGANWRINSDGKLVEE